MAKNTESLVGRTPNILSFDIEDWFHILDIPSATPLEKWDSFPSRVEKNFMTILDWLDEHEVKSTCFFLAWIGLRFPHLVNEAALRGHEIASHGFAHQLVYVLDSHSFYRDITDAKAILEDVSGQVVSGYRAPGFSVTERTPWFFETLAQAGYRYDSSVFPATRGHGGMAAAAVEPHAVETESGAVTEFPISVVSVLGRRICFSGGGYLRLLPYWFIARGIRCLNRRGLPAVVYLHPRDFDAGQPRLRMPMHRRFKSYVNLRKTEMKLKRLLQDFSFTRFDDYVKQNPME